MELEGLSQEYVLFFVLFSGLLLAGYGSYGLMSQSPVFSGSVMVNGTVESSNIVELNSRSSSSYRPEVAYSYRVEGVEYLSTNIYRGDGVPSFNTREKADLGLEEGDRVKVYLTDFNSPESSFLRHGRSPRPFLFLVSGLALVGFVVYRRYG